MKATWLEILGFITSGGLLGFLGFKINYRKAKVEEWINLISEYKEQVKGLKEEVQALRKELNDTRDKLEDAIAKKTIYEIRLAQELGVDLSDYKKDEDV